MHSKVKKKDEDISYSTLKLRSLLKIILMKCLCKVKYTGKRDKGFHVVKLTFNQQKISVRTNNITIEISKQFLKFEINVWSIALYGFEACIIAI